MTTPAAIDCYDWKRPDEGKHFGLDYSMNLDFGVTIASGTCKVVAMDDADESDDLTAMKSGSAFVADVKNEQTGAVKRASAKLVQKITGGADGTWYSLIFSMLLSNGETHVRKKHVLVSLNRP
jgi:hypothetical protein